MCNSSPTKTEATDTSTPWLCRFWSRLRSTAPSIQLFGLDVGLTLLSALFLTMIRFAAEKALLEYYFQWPQNSLVTKLASSSVAAIVHSTCLVPALAVCFFTVKRYNPSARMSDETTNVYWRDTVDALLQFCTGYMIYDGLLNIVWLKYTMLGAFDPQDGDMQFLGHHVATILYMTATRQLQAGHQSAMICMLLGELTNPLHNLFYVLEAAQRLDCCNGSLSQTAFRVVEWCFSALYVCVRAGIAPVFFLHLTYNLWTVGIGHISKAWLAFWTFLVWGVEIGSIPWIIDCWNKVSPGSLGSQEL